MQNNRKTAVIAETVAIICEAMEARQMLSTAPWSMQDQQIHLGDAAAHYPLITGAGQTVAIIDRGVDYNHPDLGGAMGKTVITSWNFETNSTDVFPYDSDSHGTGTAGQIAAGPHEVNGQLYQGIAPAANIIALKTTGTQQITAAFDWIIAHRAQYNIVAVNYVDFANSNEAAYGPEMQTLTNAGQKYDCERTKFKITYPGKVSVTAFRIDATATDL